MFKQNGLTRPSSQSYSIAFLLSSAAIIIAIEVAIEIASSSYDRNIIALGVVILVCTILNVIAFIGLGMPSLRESTMTVCYLVSATFSTLVFSFGVFFRLFFATTTSQEENNDSILFAMVALSLSPCALLTVSNNGWKLVVQVCGVGIVLATQLAFLIIIEAADVASYNRWLTWVLYLGFLLLAWIIPHGNQEGTAVSPEPTLFTPPGEDDLIAKTTEESRVIRQLIGNVAHDLKTPLSSFMVGLGLIQDWIHDLQHLCKKNPSAETFALLNQIETALHDAQITDTFMIATINRCIEYTKSTTGIKLTPKHESVKVLDAINFALLCMNHSNTQFTFRALPIEVDTIASHVFTDQQWLQENLLCLLSNAAKYSHSGEITVRVYLQSRSSRNNIDTTSNTRDLSEEVGGSKTPTAAGEQRMMRANSSRCSTAPAMSMSSPSSPISQQMRHFSVSRLNLIEEDLVFEIEDHGIGVPEEKKPFLFGAFAQTQKMAGGTGLGLYSLAKRVQALNGSFGVKSRRDETQGSCFWFAIPYQPDDSAAVFEEHDSNYITKKSLSSTTPLDCNSSSDRNTARIGHHLNRRASFALNIPLTIVSSDKQRSIELQQYSSKPAVAPSVDTTAAAAVHSSSPLSLVIPKTSEDKIGRTVLSGDQQQSIEKKPRILLVDDSAPILKVTKMLLQRHGYAVDIAENGFVAVQFIEKCYHQRDPNRYEVVLMDLQMPVMDGLESAKRMREVELGANLTSLLENNVKPKPLLIIGLSANSDDATLSTVADAGFDSFLPKPFRIEDFHALLKQMKDAIAADLLV